MANMPEICPLIYTPTVGEACLEFSHIYRKPEGMVGILNWGSYARSHSDIDPGNL